jgi:exopolyphosphatase/guanosine-5'-triphosphate,3'-diphosphate pyrophosphatase
MPRYAAIDIGSNSVRMMVADLEANQKMQILAEDRQVTRLGMSVFQDGRISEDAMRFVAENLARHAQVIRKFDPRGVRAVATSAVRDASNQLEFVAKAEEALGYPVEIVSGSEEARLIHLGVQARWPQPDRRLLTVDVGGGSSEIIASDHGVLAESFSKPLGAVRLTAVFLKHDPPLPVELQQMNEFINEKLAEPVARLKAQTFDRTIGTSATAAALVSAINKISRPRREDADRLPASLAEIRKLYQDLSKLDLSARRKVTGIGPRRAELIVAGAAVFLRVLEAFGQGSLFYSVAGLRDGIIADLATRGAGSSLSQLTEDQRRVVQAMAAHYGVQAEHADKVASLAHDLFLALTPLHKLPPQQGRMLEAAAYLHDIGHYVSDTGHHKHSYYLVLNSDMAGFTDAERQFIASLCRYHRKSSPTLRHPQFQALDASGRQSLIFLTPLLRLADSLDRGHAQRVGRITVELRSGNVVLTLHPGGELELEMWAAERIADLFHEAYGVPLVVNVAQTKPPAPSLLSGSTGFEERPAAPPGSRGSA